MKSKETKKYSMYGIMLIAALLLVMFTGLNLNVLNPATVTDENTFWTIDEITYRESMDGYIAFITVTYDNNHPIYDEDTGESAICETFEFKFHSIEGFYGIQRFEDINIPYGTSYQLEITERGLPAGVTPARMGVWGFDENGNRYIESEKLIVVLEPEPNPDTDPEPGVQTESTPGFTIFITLMAILSMLYYQRK